MNRWSPPTEWGAGAHAHHLKNLYIYFWRWATLKVFGSGWHDSTGEPGEDRYGIVCFITVAGFLNGPGFQKMREDLRRDSSEIWVVDCSPEGHQPEVPTRIFQGVQQPVCIVLAARVSNKPRDIPARVRYLALPKGKRDAKFESLAKLSLAGPSWVDGANGWREPFLPQQTGAWASFPSLAELFLWSGPGVKTHRTWVISPDVETLEDRWKTLQHENDPIKKELLFHPDPGVGNARARYVGKTVAEVLGAYPTRPTSVEHDKQPLVSPIRYGFRSFDRQWLPPDIRLLSRPRPELWSHYSIRQIYLTTLEASSPTSGPAVTLTSLVPDQDHYKGSFGGRVYPLWGDRAAAQPNIKPALLNYLAKIYGQVVRAEDVMAYLSALMAQPAFIAQFAAELVRPGLRVPVTADAKLFAEAVALGNEVIWLHCFGERFADPAANRPKQAPRLPKSATPSIPTGGMIPSSPEPLPDTMDYDPATRRLTVGKGYIDNVSPEMWAYEVSGKKILWQWFSYRRRDRSRPVIGEKRAPSLLSSIQPKTWLPEYTTDLLDLLHVLGRLIALEPKQADLLNRICAGPLRSTEELRADGVFPEAASSKSKVKSKS